MSSNHVNDVYVTSDSKDILKIGEEFGAKAIKRPYELSDDVIFIDFAYKGLPEELVYSLSELLEQDLSKYDYS